MLHMLYGSNNLTLDKQRRVTNGASIGALFHTKSVPEEPASVGADEFSGNMLLFCVVF